MSGLPGSATSDPVRCVDVSACTSWCVLPSLYVCRVTQLERRLTKRVGSVTV